MVTHSQELKQVDPIVKKALAKNAGVAGGLIPVLQVVQEHYGYLPEGVLEVVADELEVPLSTILGVATFYSQFYLAPLARNLIKVCHGTACHVAGAEQISASVGRTLGVGEKEATQDKKFSYERVNCIGCCSLAPAAMVNKDTHGCLTPGTVKDVIKKYD
ncbi:MAG: NADH-quinone oxidoreductase subunit NuoE [Terriglobia bacterium]